MNLPLPALPSFDYARPASREEALKLLSEADPEVRPMLGGTDLFVQLRAAARQVRLLVDIKRLPGMQEIAYSPKSGLRIGAGATMNMIAGHPEVQRHYAILTEAARSVASYQLRNRATIGGNLCNASPAADTAPATLVLEAELTAIGPSGERRLPVGEFFQGPGKTALAPDEILLQIDYPAPPKGAAGRYLKLGRNAQGDLAIVSVAIFGFPDSAAKSGFRFRLAVGSAAPTPFRASEAEALLAAEAITDKTIEKAAAAAREASRPIDDLRASARYRREMVAALTRRGLAEVWNELKEGDR